MKYTAKKKIMNKIRKKLSGKRGFSLGELLAATIILLLASQPLQYAYIMNHGQGLTERCCVLH